MQVSARTFGCVAVGSRADENESTRIVDRAINVGLNLIDPTNIYTIGAVEEIVGTALAQNGKQDEIVLASRISGQMVRNAVRRVSEIAHPGSSVTDYWEGNVYAPLRAGVGIK